MAQIFSFSLLGLFAFSPPRLFSLFSDYWQLRAVFSVYCTLDYSVITAQRLMVIGSLADAWHFLRYWEKELLLLILEAEMVFYIAGVAMVSALLISRVVFLFFLLVEQFVFCRSINASKKSCALNFFDFYFDFDFDFVFFFWLQDLGGEVVGFFLSPRLIIT